MSPETPRPSRLTLFLTCLRLGLTSFGGPVAHLGYFHKEYVERKRWIDEAAYADLVALCQFLPGPASSQIGFAIGLRCRGLVGGILAFIGFTLPSAALLIAAALGLASIEGDLAAVGWITGLKVAAVAVVADAVWGMASKLCPDRRRATIALGATALIFLLPGSTWVQVGCILVGAAVGWALYRHETANHAPASEGAHPSISASQGKVGPAVLCLTLFLVGLVILPLVASGSADPLLAQFASTYRSGALVFGGGHVVLPLLETDWVGTPMSGEMSRETFLAGYGAAQAVPGPLFTFAAYLGAAAEPGGIGPGLLACLAIFLPGFLLVLAMLPFWDRLRRLAPAQAALKGTNAAVVGILFAAFLNPVWPAGLMLDGALEPHRLALALACFAALRFWNCPSWGIVAFAAGVGWLAL